MNRLTIPAILITVALAMGGVALYLRSTTQPQLTSAEFREYYLDGCIVSKEVEAYCKCTIDDLSANNSQLQLERMAIKMEKDGRITKPMNDTINRCAHHLRGV